MQEKWKELQVILEEMKTMKKKEYFLILAVCLLSGLVIGMLVSPRRLFMVGNNNGNKSVSGRGKCKGCEYEEDDAYDWED